MSKVDWKAVRAEILSRIDVVSEYQKMGVEFTGSTSDKGFAECKNPYKKDNDPSAGVYVGQGTGRGTLVTFNSAGGMREKLSFFDLCRDFYPGIIGKNYGEIVSYWAKEKNVKTTDKKDRPPTEKDVNFFAAAISDEVRDYLHNHRGLNDNSITKYKIGFSEKQQRVTFPVFDQDGQLVNIRKHAWKKEIKPKSIGVTGYNQKRLWGIDRLVKAAPGSTIAITEGEFDSMLLEQESGLLSVSPTNGKEAFDPEWVKAFSGHHAVLVWDCDEAGRDAVNKSIRSLFRSAVRKGEVLSLKIIWLFENPKDKENKDFTDYIVKAGGTGKDLLEKIAAAAPEDFSVKAPEIPEPIKLKSFSEIDDPEYAGKRVQCDIMIFGENTEAYHAPTKVRVLDCEGRKKIGCSGRADWQFSCDEPIPIKIGDRIQLTAVHARDTQLEIALQKFVCDKGRHPVVEVEDIDRTTLREVLAHQVITGTSATELVEKSVYINSPKIYPVGKYRAIGYVHTHPKNQMPTMMIDSIEAQEEDWQAFRIDDAKPHLRSLQQYDLMTGEIIDDLMFNVTRIYERYDIHIGVLLTLCSPLWIDFHEDEIIRGWLSAALIGDSGTGKSTVFENTLKFAGVGTIVSGQTASRTGIVYGLEHNERTGWRVKAGALLKMNKQILLIDEAQDVDQQELKTMADAIDRGRLKIDRIATKEFEAQVRCLFSCNPKNPFNAADQKTMGSFRFGCESIKDVFPKMMIRRFDVVMFAASNDIRDKSLIYNVRRPTGIGCRLTPESLKALIFYAWSLTHDKIKLSPEINSAIRNEAESLSAKFGGCDDLPIVYAEDFRKNFCRMCVAAAVLDLSSSDDFKTISVEKKHVDFISTWLDSIYASRNCQLDKYAEQYRKENYIVNEADVVRKLEAHINEGVDRKEHLSLIVRELLRCSPDNQAHKIQQTYFRDILDIDRSTIYRELKPFIEERLIKSSRGYLPTPKLFQLSHYLRDTKSTILDLDE
ncbi:MAG: AAA family ATPase [Desulfobacterales bacterium]|jgi:hypothetical protein|nr:AAA family ATPase [Desulfobacterales bacterium]